MCGARARPKSTTGSTPTSRNSKGATVKTSMIDSGREWLSIG
jgi:hypothetical protein